MAPATTPPRTPAPTAQPKQRASAVFGAANAASPRLAAAARPMADLRMDDPLRMENPRLIGRAPIQALVSGKCPCPREPALRHSRQPLRPHSLAEICWVESTIANPFYIE